MVTGALHNSIIDLSGVTAIPYPEFAFYVTVNKIQMCVICASYKKLLTITVPFSS